MKNLNEVVTLFAFDLGLSYNEKNDFKESLVKLILLNILLNLPDEQKTILNEKIKMGEIDFTIESEILSLSQSIGLDFNQANMIISKSIKQSVGELALEFKNEISNETKLKISALLN